MKVRLYEINKVESLRQNVILETVNNLSKKLVFNQSSNAHLFKTLGTKGV